MSALHVIISLVDISADDIDRKPWRGHEGHLTRPGGAAAADACRIPHPARAGRGRAPRLWDHAGGGAADGQRAAPGAGHALWLDQAPAGGGADPGSRRAPRPRTGRRAAALLPADRVWPPR